MSFVTKDVIKSFIEHTSIYSLNYWMIHFSSYKISTLQYIKQRIREGVDT